MTSMTTVPSPFRSLAVTSIYRFRFPFRLPFRSPYEQYFRTNHMSQKTIDYVAGCHDMPWPAGCYRWNFRYARC